MRIGITLTSSMHVGEEYISLTRSVAERIASEGWGVVFGGTSYGMMKELAEAYKNAGGKDLVGVMAEDLMKVTKGYEAYENLDEQHIEPNMELRKHRIAELSHGFLMLPGGYGTFEEIGSFVGGNVNKLYSKPIVLLNYRGFYDTLIQFFDEMTEKKFSKISLTEAVHITDSLDSAIFYFKTYSPKELSDKFV
jgi:uncharacterized protein (TIGR00730 family)